MPLLRPPAHLLPGAGISSFPGAEGVLEDGETRAGLGFRRRRHSRANQSAFLDACRIANSRAWYLEGFHSISADPGPANSTRCSSTELLKGSAIVFLAPCRQLCQSYLVWIIQSPLSTCAAGSRAARHVLLSLTRLGQMCILPSAPRMHAAPLFLSIWARHHTILTHLA
jgi:hypothetical protein